MTSLIIGRLRAVRLSQFSCANIRYRQKKSKENTVLKLCLKKVFVIKDKTLVGLTNFGKTLESIVIPKRVKGIGEKAFKDCEIVKTIKIPKGAQYIDDCAFEGCFNLTSINIPDTVTHIGFEAFYDCENLTSITIPVSVKTIDSWTFQGCSNLT